MRRVRLWCGLIVAASCLAASTASAQAASVTGTVRDETGGALPGATVELRRADGTPPLVAVADAQGAFRFERVAAGRLSGHLHADQFRQHAPRHRGLRHRRRAARRGAAPVAQRRRDGHRQAHLRQSGRRREPGRESRRHRRSRPARARSPRGSSTPGRSCEPARCSKRCPASSSASTAAKARPTSTTCAASISITAPTSRRRSPACR